MSKSADAKGPAYPTEAHGSIPAFKSYEEEAEYWDTHDFSEVWDQAEPVTARVAKNLSASMQIRFDTETDHELASQARERGIKKSTLVRMVVLDWLKQTKDNRQAS